jgi:hypothetical protein
MITGVDGAIMTRRKRQSRKGQSSKATADEGPRILTAVVVCVIVGAALVLAIGASETPDVASTTPRAIIPVPTDLPRTPAPLTLYTTTRINARDCPSASECPVLFAIPAGTAVTGIERVEGENMLGSAVWWRVRYDGDEVYIHSTLLTADAPIPPTPVPTADPAVAATTIPRPGNCSTAVAMGLSAEQAAQWSHLDGDDDGVACYGD